MRGPETSNVVRVAGIPPYALPPPDARTRQIMTSWEAYSGRLAPSAGPTRTRWALWPGDNLTPDAIISAQRSAVTSGLPLEWMELIDQVYSRDGHYSSVTDQRVEDVIKGSWRLTRAAPDDAGTVARNFAAEAYTSCARWRDGLGWLLLSNLYGYNAVEVEWAMTRITFPGPKGETIGPVTVALPRRLHNVHPKHFRFDLGSDDPLFYIGNSYQPLPIGKFIFLDGAGLHPIKIRRGNSWQCVWYSLFRSLSWAAWSVHVERFSLPVPLIEYDGDVAQYQEYKDSYLDILNSLGSGKGAIIPKEGAEFTIKDPPQGGRSNDPASALSDACDAGQSIRVLGATLTAKIGNVGSFAASSTHAEVKYAKEENDAGRLWERIDEQLTEPMIIFNAEAISRALSEHGYNITPEMLCRRIPKGKHRVPRESDPITEMQIADIAVNKLSLPLSEEGMLDRIDFPRATSVEDRVKGEPQPIPAGGALIPNAKAAEEGGVKVPDKPPEGAAGKGSGGEGGSGPKGPTPAAPAKLDALTDAIAILVAEAERGDVVAAPIAMDHATQPRDAKGRFAAVAGAKATVAQHIAAHLTSQGQHAEAKGSTIHLKGGGTIEIGNKGDRTYNSTRAKVQHAVEQHLKEHADKSVRDWAAKTQPAPPPPPAPRKQDPKKVAARAAKLEAKEKARAARKQERTELAATRKQAAAEKTQALEAKRASKAAAVKALGAPLHPDGKIDATKVPGAPGTRGGYKIATSFDPENSYKGRSFFAASVADQAAEFLGSPARGGGINEHILTGTMGAGGAKVRDTGGTFDAVSEKYGKRVETFEQAFELLSRGDKPMRNGKRDWRGFDIATLRECQGFERVELPQWVHEADNDRKVRDEMAGYYADQDAGTHETEYTPPEGEPEYGHHQAHAGEDVSEVPF
jgi:hypothetical protein